MFVRADQLLIEQTQDKFPLHVLDFHWDGFEPHMECRDLRNGAISEFDLKDVRFKVSKKKTCIGYFDDDGKYRPCPKSSPVSKFEQCADCSTESFIPHQECIFEPRCDGEICDLEFCKRQHVLYIAFYDTDLKIGMSSSRRVEKRLVEQGADAFSIIGSFPSRKAAREAEKKISLEQKIPQSHRQEALLRSLVRSVDVHEIGLRHEALRTSLGDAYGMTPESLQLLDRYPIPLPLPQAPKLQESWGKHSGAFIGIKGRWLIYDSDGFKAINLSDLPARFVSR
jgi:hypothetical protein